VGIFRACFCPRAWFLSWVRVRSQNAEAEPRRVTAWRDGIHKHSNIWPTLYLYMRYAYGGVVQP
jgi:hypothetical protein